MEKSLLSITKTIAENSYIVAATLYSQHQLIGIAFFVCFIVFSLSETFYRAATEDLDFLLHARDYVPSVAIGFLFHSIITHYFGGASPIDTAIFSVLGVSLIVLYFFTDLVVKVKKSKNSKVS